MHDRSRRRLYARLDRLEAARRPNFIEAYHTFREGGPLPEDPRTRRTVVELVGMLAEIRRRRGAVHSDERLEDLKRRAGVQ